MATYQLTGQDGGTYEIDAPNENAAVAALLHATGQAPPRAESKAPIESKGVLGTVDDYVRAIANGMTFGLADRFAAGMGSATGVGGNQGDYSGNLKSEQGRTEQFASESPVSSTVANVAGAVAVPLGAIGAASRGATLGTKTLLGMGAGAGIGGVQGAVSSHDLTDLPQTGREAVKGAILGAGVGAVIPGGARIIGSGYNALANAVRGNAEGVSRSATQHVIDALMADNPAKVQGELSRLGPDAMLADAGPALLGKAQGASLNSDEGRSVLQNALTARNQGTNDRIAGEVNRVLGPAEDPVTVANAIRAHRSAVDAANYPAAFGRAPEVDTSNVLVQLGPMIKNSVGMEAKALTNLRDMLMTQKAVPRLDPQTGYRMTDAKGNPLFDMVPTPQTSAEVLHKIKGEMDNVIQYDQPGLGIPAAALSRQQGALKHLRGLLNETIEQQVPGYANANAASAALAKRGEAVDLGTQYLGSGKTTASPDRFAAEYSQLQPGEQAAFAKGSRGSIDRALGTKANDLEALRSELQGEGGWNTEKIGTVHGQDAADSLVNSVNSNLKFRDTFNKVVENSQTAQRQAAAKSMQPTPASETNLINPNMTLTGLAASGTKNAVASIVNTLMRRDPTKAAGELADILSQQGPKRDATVQAILDAIDRRKGNAAMASGVGTGGSLLAAIAASAYARQRQKQGQQ